MAPKILVVCVIYNEKLQETITYKSLLIHCENIFIIDNSPIPFNPSSYWQKGWTYQNHPENIGLSKAYNEAAKFAYDNGYDWILLCDQDTYFPSNALQYYIDAIKNNPTVNLFCPRVKLDTGEYMSPTPIKNYLTSLSDRSIFGEFSLSKFCVINSGMLINVSAFISVGGYNDLVWLDFSDIQFIERFKNKYKNAYALSIECIQSFSNKDTDFEKKLKRFTIFCQSIKNFIPTEKWKKLWILIVVLRRATSLSVQNKTTKPFSIFYKNYLQ